MFEIGNSLREARVRRGIEFAQAEQATKIRGKYLRSLEEERFELLPSETYVKGFLRTYADYLGLDGQLYVDEFNSRFVTDDRRAAARRSSARPQRRNRRFETVVVLVVLSVDHGGHRDRDQRLEVVRRPSTRRRRRGRLTRRRRSRAAGPYLVVKGLGGSSLRRDPPRRPGRHRGLPGHGREGRDVPFKGKSYWVSVSTPEHLVITVGGKRVRVSRPVRRG